MTTDDDAHARARRIVEETLIEAGVPVPESLRRADPGPPASPSEARRTAHRIVQESVAADERRRSAVRPDPPELDEVPAEPAPPSVVEDVVPAEPAPPSVVEDVVPAEPAPPVFALTVDDDAAERARRIVDEVIAEHERHLATSEPAEEGHPPATVPVVPAVIPDVGVDLLPPEVGTAPASDADGTVTRPVEAVSGDAVAVAAVPEDPAPQGPATEDAAVPPLPVATLERWWWRYRIRRRRREEMAAWAPDAEPPPRRTGRWLLATLIAVGAIAVLFPLLVDALRRLVAL